MIEAPRALRPALLAVSILGACSPALPVEDLPRGTLVIGSDGDDVRVDVSVAETSEAQSRGLMGVESMGEDVGMVFLEEEPVAASFWMKGTLIPLSIAFWGPDERIFRILDMDPCGADPCPSYDPRGEWIGALEVNQGFFRDHGVEVGDAVHLER